MVFLSIEKTLNWTMPFAPITSWPWNELNFTQLVGLNDLTPYGIELLRNRLYAD